MCEEREIPTECLGCLLELPWYGWSLPRLYCDPLEKHQIAENENSALVAMLRIMSTLIVPKLIEKRVLLPYSLMHIHLDRAEKFKIFFPWVECKLNFARAIIK